MTHRAIVPGSGDPLPAMSRPAGQPELAPIVVKFLYRESHRGSHDLWLRQLPGRRPQWGRCRFRFDPDERVYDWLVVYHRLPRPGSGKLRTESLACPRARTLLVTAEPSAIKTYGKVFLRQYGHVLTSQEPVYIRHPGMIYGQCGFPWFYGRSSHPIAYDDLIAAPPPRKTRLISTVCSSKQQRHTLHRARFAFTERLRAEMPELDVYGHGVRPLEDKAEALDPYQYHLAIENQIAPHHWTEKLADAFLGYALPFYAGCPNAGEYFPPKSFIPIDIRDFDRARATIRSAIEANEYEKRLDAIIEARRLVLREYNLFAVLSREIERLDAGGRDEPVSVGSAGPEYILGRTEFWKKHPVACLGYLGEKAARRLKSYLVT